MSIRIYTRTGDDGTTGLFGGQRILKCDHRMQAIGDVDELNAHLGAAIALGTDEGLLGLLASIQRDLFDLGADLATPVGDPDSRGSVTIRRIGAELTESLEQAIDVLDVENPPLRNFILPGGAPLAATLHVCRAVCRRAERSVIAVSQLEATNPEVTRYLNRLSDLLFVVARVANARAGVADVIWEPGESPSN